MAKMTIQTGEDNPVLRKESIKVTKFDRSLKKFAKELKETMLREDGLGLAAPQVGEHRRIIVVTLNYKASNPIVIEMVNPEIVSHGKDKETKEEGCLSLPGVYGKVERWKDLKISFRDLDGEEMILKLDKLNARVVQHEMDHLDGVLFVDKLKGKNGEENILM